MARSEVIVVGSGVVGAATALGLARDVNVTVVADQRHRDAATGASGAMLGVFGECTDDGDDVQLAARYRSRQLYGRWLDGIGRWNDEVPDLCEGTTIIAFSTSVRDRVNVAAIRRAAERWGEPVEDLDPGSIGDVRPSPNVAVLEAIRLPRESWLDARQLLGALDVALRRHPRVELVDDRVTRVVVSGEIARGVEVTGGRVMRASATVLCAGAATGSLLANSGLKAIVPPVVEGKGTALLLSTRERGGCGVVRTPNRQFACGLHLVPQSDGRIYLGATNRVSTVPGSTGRATAGEIHLLLQGAIEEFDTHLEWADVEAVLQGRRPLTADGLPLCGLTEIDGLAVGTGTYRNGVLLAPLMAEIIGSELRDGGSEGQNPFACAGRAERLHSRMAAASELMRENASDLLRSLLEPGGRLPYGRFELLAALLTRALPALVNSDAPEAKVLRDLLYGVPLPEMAPEIALLMTRSAVK